MKAQGQRGTIDFTLNHFPLFLPHIAIELTLPMLGLLSSKGHKDAKIFENRLSPVMLVFIR